jgi:pimeloyl-ACP methyl ester carboxylesterase
VFVEETGDFAQSTVPDIEPGLGFPIVVVTAGEPWWDDPPIDQAWRRSHEVIAGRSSARELVVAEGSGHDVPEEHPDVIVDAVKRVLTRIEGVN